MANTLAAAMPLIQFLTLHGFAVFVPNVRGSTGYGFAYMTLTLAARYPLNP